MILFEITNSEGHPAYQSLEVSNSFRQLNFLEAIVKTALQVKRPFLSQTVIKALNFHVITCLHINAGEFRPCPVSVGDFLPPQHYRVSALMDDFVNSVNRMWEYTDPIHLASLVLWRINNIHPFINGNGKTARTAAYFVLCVKVGGWLPGKTILPERLSMNREAYIAALKAVDRSSERGALDLSPLRSLIATLLGEQLASA